MFAPIYTGKKTYCEVHEHLGTYYLRTTCPGVAWHEFAIRLNDEETADFLRAGATVEDVALALCRDSDAFKGRHVSQDEWKALFVEE